MYKIYLLTDRTSVIRITDHRRSYSILIIEKYTSYMKNTMSMVTYVLPADNFTNKLPVGVYNQLRWI